ncbi:MAG: YaeQ family protein [Rhodocyclaceae bacterium]|nr:YaeQ family protein [Rhodocyclaceae bacterium]
MALKSTVFKATLQLSDMDRQYYAEHALTIARHPSETDERMMIRLLAFALHADPRLGFGRGLSSDDEAALWLHDYDGTINLWIEVGLPDERILRKACARSERVVLLAYGGRAVEPWWQASASALRRHDKLEILTVSSAESAALGELASRNMQLQVSIQDGTVWISNDDRMVEIHPARLQ